MKWLQCRTLRLHTLFEFLYLATIVSTVTGVLFNSSISCTRGAVQTPYSIDCPNGGGTNQIMIIRRVFYGATPLTRGCNRTAQYDNCCKTYANAENCVFENDADLESLSLLCTGRLGCSTSSTGKRPSSTLGNCSQLLYPSVTSFSFVEYDCVDSFEFVNVCGNVSKSVRSGDAFIDMNAVSVNTIMDTECGCLVSGGCNTTLTFVGLHIQLHQSANNSQCSDELIFQDMKSWDTHTNVSCKFDDDTQNVQTTSIVLRDKILFESATNIVDMRWKWNGPAKGRFIVRIKTSDFNSTLHLRCGAQRTLFTANVDMCSGDSKTSLTTSTVYTSSESTTHTSTQVNTSSRTHSYYSVTFSSSETDASTTEQKLSSSSEKITHLTTNFSSYSSNESIFITTIDSKAWSTREQNTVSVNDRAILSSHSAEFTTTTIIVNETKNKVNSDDYHKTTTHGSALYSGIIVGVILPIIFFALFFCIYGVIWMAYPAKREEFTITLHRDVVSQENLVSVA